MAHLQYMPGDPRLVDQLVYELKSKGIFDKFRKECIADVDTRPAYQNLRQRVENSVSTFLSRQCWKLDLNKNQLREKLRKHILDGNYLEQGVERIVDQVVNPKVASVFIPQVEDLVYNYLGITRKKSITTAETSNGKSDDLLPTDLEAVSPGSVKSNDDKETIDVEMTDDTKDSKMDIEEANGEVKDENSMTIDVIDKEKDQDTRLSGISELMTNDSESIDKISIPLPSQDISLDNIPAPDNSPPKQPVDLETIQLPSEPNPSTDIPLPDEPPKEKDQFFKPVNSDDDDSSSDSSLRRNMSPLTPIRNFNNENSCDAQQAFENDSDSKTDEKKEPSSFRFTIEAKCDNSSDVAKVEKKDTDQSELTFQFNNQVNISFNTPLYEDSSNSNNLHIDYESDVNSKINIESKLPEGENSEDSKKDKKVEDKKSSQKSSHRSRESSRHASSKDKRSDSKHSSRDSSRHDRKSKDESKSKSSNKERERSRDRSERKDSRDSSKHRSSHKSSSNRDSKSSSHRSSSSSQRHSSKHSDDKKSSSKDKSSESSKNREKSRDSKSLHRSDKEKDRKSKKEDKDKKKGKKDTDDHYSLSGRGNHTRRSTDRDSNDGSSSSKGSSNPSNTKSTESKKENKGSSKSENTSTCGESTSPSDKEVVNTSNTDIVAQARPIVRVERDLEVPIAAPPRLPFVPDVTLKKPKFAANFEEAKRLMKMRKFLDEEQKRMNQEAALLLEFQANVRPSLSQVYSSIPGPELEFACVTNPVETAMESQPTYEIAIEPANIESRQMTVQEIENIIGVNVTSNISDTMYFEEEEEPKREVIENEPNTTAQEVESRLVELTKDDLVDDKSQDGIKPEITEDEGKIEDRYDDNIDKPFSDIIDEITKYKNASDSKIQEKDDPNMEKLHDDENKKRTEFFEITIITEELTEGEDDSKKDNSDAKSEKKTTLNSPVRVPGANDKKPQGTKPKKINGEYALEYFGETEKYNAELERDKFGTFLKNYIEQWATSKVYLINCDKYEENIIKDVLDTMGCYETVSYYKNGHVNLTSVVKNVNLIEEVSLPVESTEEESPKNKLIFSPVKSDCSFELSSEYDAKLQEMVNKTSRQEVMEIILGGVIETPSEMPKIDYCSESSIESGELKRKCEETVNNNTQILTPNKIRKISESDQISSTTEETEISNNNRVQSSTRSKYLGRARRVGLSRPKKPVLPNSPSSDKSVENYEQNTPSTQTPNGKLKSTPRLKIQRYDTSDLYKPKLHYLSRRNNIS